MLFNINFGKGPSVKPDAKVGIVGPESKQNAGYVPEGLTKEQYAKFLAEEAKKKDATKKRFPLGKEPETLTEWFDATAQKYGQGREARKGHRLVKAKYEEFYGPEPPL